MAESEYSQDNLAAIRTHLNNLEQMVRFNTATNPNNKAAIEALFESRSGLAELYIAMEGEPRTQDELAAVLTVNQSTVSRMMKILLDAGLAIAIPPAGSRRQTAYMRSGVEALLGVSRIARARVVKDAKTNSESVTSDRPGS